MRYFIGRNGQQLGPFDAQQVRDQLNTGLLSYEDLVWREGMTGWAPLRTEFPPLEASTMPPPGLAAFPSPATTPPAAAAAGNPFVSAVTREEAPAEPQLADRGKRLCAVVLDTLIAGLIAAPGLVWFIAQMTAAERSGNAVSPEDIVLRLSAPILLILIPILVFLIYQTWLLTARGQTLGKKLLKIRIVRTDGSNPGFMHAVILRSFVMQLIGAIPLVGGVVSIIDPLLIFREDRRCIHDLIADTTVIDA